MEGHRFVLFVPITCPLCTPCHKICLTIVANVVSMGASEGAAAGVFGAQRPKKGMFRTVGQLYKVRKYTLIFPFVIPSMLRVNTIPVITAVFYDCIIILPFAFGIAGEKVNDSHLVDQNGFPKSIKHCSKSELCFEVIPIITPACVMSSRDTGCSAQFWRNCPILGNFASPSSISLNLCGAIIAQ